MNTVWELTWGLYKPSQGYHYTYVLHTNIATVYISQTVGSYETCGTQLFPGMRFHCTSCHKCPILRQWHKRIPELSCCNPTATARQYNLHLVLESDKPMPLSYQTAAALDDPTATLKLSVSTLRIYCVYGCVGDVSYRRAMVCCVH